jgi:hypothetical protein
MFYCPWGFSGGLSNKMTDLMPLHVERSFLKETISQPYPWTSGLDIVSDIGVTVILKKYIENRSVYRTMLYTLVKKNNDKIDWDHKIGVVENSAVSLNF